jgi:hypothetical protein
MNSDRSVLAMRHNPKLLAAAALLFAFLGAVPLSASAEIRQMSSRESSPGPYNPNQPQQVEAGRP